jgi:hypothetical protein
LSENRTPAQQTAQPAHAGGAERASVFLRAGLHNAAEAFAVLAVVGFLFSGLLNSVVFQAWGLSFFQIATPTDVLMAGVELSFDLFVPIILLTSPFLIGITVYNLQSLEVKNEVVAFLDKVDVWIFIVLFLLILLILAVSSAWPSFDAVEISDIPLYLLLMGVAMSAFLFLMWIVVVAGTEDLANHEDLYRKWQRSDRLFRSGLTLIALVFSLVGLYGRYAKLAGYGFLPGHWASSSPTGCEGRIMWLGARSTVVACGPPRHPHFAIISTQNGPGLVIRDVPPAQPSPAAPPPAAAASPAGPLANPGFSTRQNPPPAPTTP